MNKVQITTLLISFIAAGHYIAVQELLEQRGLKNAPIFKAYVSLTTTFAVVAVLTFLKWWLM